jgi:hypothetical protein
MAKIVPNHGSAGRISWSEILGLRARYQRSVHLERDVWTAGALDGYLITPLVQRVTERLLAGLGTKENCTRSWSITGPYGSGKSAFALFLAEALAPPDQAEGSRARSLLRERIPGVNGHFRSGGSFADSGLLPVLITGERRNPVELLLEGMLRAGERFWSGPGAKPTLLEMLRGAVERAARGEVSIRESIALLEDFVGRILAAKTKGAHGVLIVVDEAGKCLEFAARSSDGDVHLLQELAEAANRSEGRIGVVVLLHQAFERYATRLGTAQRNEWAKVQGRYEDIPFGEHADQIVRLLASALVRRQQLPPSLKKVAREAAVQATKLVRLPGTQSCESLADVLEAVYPLHPTTALVVGPLFRGKLAQNERSLFAFLSSGEPGGFSDYLRTTVVAADSRPYTLDRLYDYVVGSLGSRLFGPQSRVWAQIEESLRRLPENASELDVRLVKTIGLLDAVGEASGVVASRAVLELAMAAESDPSIGRRVEESLRRLQGWSRIVFRRFRNAYQLWDGSDLDVDELVREARHELEGRTTLAQRIDRLAQVRPIVARRHFLRTGTLRYFEVVLADEKTFEFVIEPSTDADGRLVLVLPEFGRDSKRIGEVLSARRASRSAPERSKPVLVGLADDVTRLRDLVLEEGALRDVLRSPRLQADMIARREVESRLAEAGKLVSEEFNALLTGRRACRWFTEDGIAEIASLRQLSSLISDLCDRAFDKAPAIRNEIVNRHSLSTTAAAARRSLLTAMVERGGEERLGMTGTPPELSMYLSVLAEHGLHHRTSNGWGFTRPPKTSSLFPAFEAIIWELEHRDGKQIPVEELYSKLSAPPFGIKEGPLPIILLAVALHLQAEVTFFEDGVFVPALNGPIIERLLKCPGRFTVQRYAVTGARVELFERLVPGRTAPKDASQLLPLVRQLLRTVRGLPDYSRNTRSISRHAQRVREALLRARDPGALLFVDLPRACDLEPLSPLGADAPAVGEFVERLRSALKEIGGAYEALLNRIEGRVARVFGLPSEPAEARRELANRAALVRDYAAEPRTKSFLKRASEENLGRKEWLVSLSTLLGGRPPDSWGDSDVDSFDFALATVAREVALLESFVVERKGETLEGGRLLRIAVAQSGQRVLEKTLVVRDSEKARIDGLCAQLREILAKTAPVLTPEGLLASLASVSADLMEPAALEREAKESA